MVQRRPITIVLAILLSVVCPTTADDVKPVLPAPKVAARVGSYGCTIDRVEKVITVLTKNGKSETRTAFEEFELRLWTKDTAGHEIWTFGPVAYADEKRAYDDCARWRDGVRKNIRRRP